MRIRLFPFTALSLAALLTGCESMNSISQLGTSLGVATGVISDDQAKSINRTTEAAVKAAEDITPEQEYYIGRAVAASIIKSYKPYDNTRANAYLNLLGQTLAMASDRPETFGGYHFLVMDTDEINAFATPGGLILVSRGLLRCCRVEDAVAAVLAHEIGHVQLAHGLQAIKKSRITSAVTILGTEAAKNLAGEQLAELTSAFEGSITDITATMVNSGYARKFETAADKAAVEILKRVGYSPVALKDMLDEMGKRIKPEGGGFAKTHPDPKVRIADIEPLLAGAGPIDEPKDRRARFAKALAGV